MTWEKQRIENFIFVSQDLSSRQADYVFLGLKINVELSCARLPDPFVFDNRSLLKRELRIKQPIIFIIDFLGWGSKKLIYSKEGQYELDVESFSLRELAEGFRVVFGFRRVLPSICGELMGFKAAELS